MKLQLSLLVYIIIILVIITISISAEIEESETEDEYYEEGEYEYYDDEEEVDDDVTSVEATITGDGDGDSQPLISGYFRNVGGGVLKVTQMLVSGTYLHDTKQIYDCLLAEEWYKTNEGDEDEDEEEEAEQEPEPEPEPEQPGRKSRKQKQAANNNKVKKPTFREEQHLKMEEKRKEKATKALLRQTYVLGPTCESLVCGSCKAIVREFGLLVFTHINDSNFKYIDDLMKGFCNMKRMTSEYSDIVGDICVNFERQKLGYKEVLVSAFEEDDNWKDVLSPVIIRNKQIKVCSESGIGACRANDFEFITSSQNKYQEQWKEDCFVCQAFAQLVEERAQLHRYITEDSIIPVVKETCDMLQLEPRYDEICREILEKDLNEISWLAYVHWEGVLKRSKSEKNFQDSLCQAVSYCKPWIPPDEALKKEIEASVEQVFW